MPNKTERLEGRNGQVYLGYLSGATMEALADRFDVAKSRIHQIIQEVRDATPAEDLAELRRVDVARLDALTEAHWNLALKGDKDATGNVLKILERRARMLGLDAAAKIEHSGKVATYRIDGVDLDEL